MIRRIIWVVVAAMLIGLGNFLGFFTRQYCFGTLSENVTIRIRERLYASILEKNVGWFDDRSHSTSVLTSTMAEETSRLNEASTTSLQPLVTAFFAIVFGQVVGYAYCWPMALGGLAIVPF